MVDEQNPLKKFLFEDVPTLEHIVEFYQKSTGVMKRRILGCIFSEKIHFNEEKDATIIYTKPIEVILQIFNELQNRGNKKVGTMTDFSLIAPQTGLEPVTLWLTADWRSKNFFSTIWFSLTYKNQIVLYFSSLTIFFMKINWCWQACWQLYFQTFQYDLIFLFQAATSAHNHMHIQFHAYKFLCRFVIDQ